MPMREECKQFESRSYANGETVRKCNLDLAPEAPWRCPANCPGYERRLVDVDWHHGSLIISPTPPEPEAEGIAELLDAAENIALEAARAYVDVARFSALVQEAKQNYVEHKLTAQQIEERAAAGVSRRIDTDQAAGRLALAESNLLTEISNLHDVSARYQRIMGSAPPATLPPLPAGIKLAGIPADAKVAMSEGLSQNPAINAAYENVRSSKLQIESRKSAYWPRVDFRVRQTWGHNIDNSGGNSKDFTAEVLLNYNLYRGGADKAREVQAVEASFQARELQEKACRDVRQTLAIAHQDVIRLNEQLGYLNQHRLSTEKTREAYRQQFDIGQRTLLDLLDTQNEFFDASRAYLNAQYNEFFAQARTLASMGKLTTALGVSRPDMPTLESLGQDRGALPAEELCAFETPAPVVVDKAKAMADAPARPKLPVQPVRPAVLPTKMVFKSDALFDFDKAVLKDDGKKNLDGLVAQIKGTQLDVAIAVGHTDAMGSEPYNQALSERRAEAVKAYLVSQGVAADKVRTQGKGETEPVASNDTEEGRAKNRRVEVTLIEATK
jgi:adhesin transport system outer membrane protein